MIRLAAELLLLDLQVDEPGQDVQQAVPLPDLFPEVGGLVAAGVLRVARAAVPLPRLKGRKRVLLPASRVVM